MADSVPPSSGKGPGGRRLPVSARLLAILIMLAGVAAFFISRLVFGEQVLCLLGSTLITFAGLGFLITGRRRGWYQTGAENREGTWQPTLRSAGEERSVASRRDVPPGLREAARRLSMTPPPAIQQPFHTELETPVEKIPVYHEPLLERVLAIVEGQGGQAEVETQREGRGVIKVLATDGQTVTMLVLEGEEPVDVSDVRGLFALVSSRGSGNGYLISSAPFTQQAYDWAGARKIRLVSEDELGELSI